MIDIRFKFFKIIVDKAARRWKSVLKARRWKRRNGIEHTAASSYFNNNRMRPSCKSSTMLIIYFDNVIKL